VFRPRLTIGAVLLATALLAQVTMTAATADTASDLDAARQRVATAQAAANAAAADMAGAEARYEELDATINELDATITQMQARAATLRDIVRQRALNAYTRGSQTSFDAVFSAEGPLDAARRVQLLDLANQNDNLAVKKLAALRADLKTQQTEIEKQRAEQQKVTDELAVKNQVVQAQLAEANQARDAFAARLEKEQADAAAVAELARLRALQAASRPINTGGDGGGAPGQIIANPGGGSFQCPVSGSAYSDSYGPRGNGFHYGIDMLVGMGTPEVAVKAGTVSYMAMDGAGGNEGYLAADDGNVYYYAHMSQFVGGARRVAQGEVIGLVGSTGLSTAPHLHFEIRLGGANGQKIDPYATLQAAGC
jgi:murein DD-endopeptidase MepM/ murein hydrolase activator NlpD